MDIYTTSFVFPRRPRITAHPGPYDFQTVASPDFPFQNIHNGHQNGFRYPNNQPQPFYNQEEYDALQAAIHTNVVMASHQHAVNISPNPLDDGLSWNYCISGMTRQVMLAREALLKGSPQNVMKVVKVNRSDILDSSPTGNPTLKLEVRRKLDEIAAQTLAHIAVVNGNINDPSGVNSNPNECNFKVKGNHDSVDLARVRLLVMVDELAGLASDFIEIDQVLHGIIAGRKRTALRGIREQTSTNIYFPSPMLGLTNYDNYGLNGIPTLRQYQSRIWITGETFGVRRAKEMLSNLVNTKMKQLIPQDAALQPRKLDWLVSDRADDLIAIMNDNATFVRFPALGSSTSIVTVYGDHTVNVSRTIRSIMQLACAYYWVGFWLLPIQYNVLLPPAPLPHQAVQPFMVQISSNFGAEITFKDNYFEIHGTENEVRSAVAFLMDQEILKVYQHEIRFQIELANEHREFISGKKNGKINKIMQTSNVKIKFETLNDHNFNIEISGSDGSVLQGLALLQEELPSEISFHVPESYHKRIIGVGGRSIQRIMKKYGVYVKFSNAEEFAQLGGYTDNDDNVVARTPFKNHMNLESLKLSVMELVNEKDRDFINQTVLIPHQLHRKLLGEKHVNIEDIESKTNSHITFPACESGSDVVTIYGPEQQIENAQSRLLDLVPYEDEVTFPPNPDLARVCKSQDYKNFVDSINREYQVTITPMVRAPAAGQNIELVEGFKLNCLQSAKESTTTVKEMLEQFFVTHNVHMYPVAPTRVHKRGDSFADAFPHFDSKLLSHPRTRGDSADFGRPHVNGSVERRLRLANSSPNVKALFDNSPVTYSYSIEDDDDSSYMTPQSDYWHPLPPPIGSGIPGRARHQEDATKRGSDSLLESKIKDHLSKPRSLSNRAQSLDLTFSLSKITEASRYPPPDSPTTSIGEIGTTSTPPSATAPSFPSVYGPPKANRSPVMSSRNHRPQFSDDGVDDVTRVMSDLGL